MSLQAGVSYTVATQWIDSTIALLTFCDSARRNQICWAAIDAIGAQLEECRRSGARVIILASGLDGHWLEHAWLRDLMDGVAGLEQTGSGAGWFTALQELSHESVISIAAIAGDCSGGGAELGWACDFRIAESEARFSQPEVDMGLTTGIGGSSRLARLAGRSAATQMVLTGEPMSARRLYELGAINEVVDRGQAVSAAVSLARTLAKKSPLATAGLKRILAKNDNTSLADALSYEQGVFQSVVTSADARSGMQQVQSAYDNALSDKPRDPD